MKRSAMSRLLHLVGAESPPQGGTTPEWVAYRNAVRRALLDVLREELAAIRARLEAVK